MSYPPVYAIVKKVLDEISNEVRRIYHQVIDPLDEKSAFEKRPPDGEISGGPLVVVVGNHSSGKSTFLNFLLAQEVQKTGMAPTDDSFTILRYGERREDRDGAAIVSNPELPFGGLNSFGPDFLAHFKMRILPIPFLRDVTLVDTPGMIDAPDPNAGRGYDFGGVVEWFAECADVVLIFFDPDRPGTTAESLQVLTQSLSRVGHKLLVVMNKMDNFRSMRDFARCYGTLCWNLGKVIKKKDIPQIYTSFVPVPGAPESVLPLDDFARAREELVEEIKRAPVRRVDNMITQALRHGERLRMHARITNAARSRLFSFRRRLYAGLVAAVIVALAVAALFTYQNDWLASLSIIAGTIIFATGFTLLARLLVDRRKRQILDNLNDLFEEVYIRELTVRNRAEDLLIRWDDVRPITRRTLDNLGIESMARLKKKHLERLYQALNIDLPSLRARLHRTLDERGGPTQAAE